MQLVARMMSPSPKDRPTASECLQHPWLIENSSSDCKRDESLISDTNRVLPLKRVWQSPFHKNITDDLYSTGILEQFDPYLEDASDILNGQFRGPGHTLLSIYVG